MLSPPAACPFAPRCRFEVEQSRQEVPPLERDRARPARRAASTPCRRTSGSARGCGAVPRERRRRPLVEVEDLRVWFPIRSGIVLDRHVGDVKAVDGVSLTIERGETLGLVGESGCGKSTVGRALLRLYEPTGGPDRVRRAPTSRTSSEGELRPLRRRMQMIFQDPYASLNPRHSVGRMVGEPLRVHGLRRQAGSAEGARAARRPSACRPTPRRRYPHEFSGRPAAADRPRARARAESRTSSSATSRSRRSTSRSRRRSST